MPNGQNPPCICKYVCVYMYMCVCVCMFVYVCVYVYISVCKCVCTYVYVSVCMFEYVYISVCLHLHVCIEVCVFICVCVCCFMSTWHMFESFRKRVSQMRKCSHQIGLWASLLQFFLINDCHEDSPSSLHSLAPGLEVYIRKQVEQAKGRKPVSTDAPCHLLQFQPLGSYTEFLPWLPFMKDHDQGG